MNLNPKTKLITESSTVKLNALANKLISEGKDSQSNCWRIGF